MSIEFGDQRTESNDDKEVDYEKIVTQTPKAILFKIHSGLEIWVPISVCDYDEDDKKLILPNYIYDQHFI